MAKIYLVIHHPFRQTDSSPGTRDRTFATSIEVIRYSRKVETHNQTQRWGWLFRSYFRE